VKKTLFLFRRDLRLHDNTALLKALSESDKVVVGFVFDSRQTDIKENKYFSENSFAFLLQSLQELEEDVSKKGGKLHFFEGLSHEVVESLIQKDGISSVYLNKDYTPFARTRDALIVKSAKKNAVSVQLFDDYTLSPVETILTGGGKPYSVFTPFMNNAAKHTVHEPVKNAHTNYHSGKLKTKTISLKHFGALLKKTLALPAGRKAGLRILHSVDTLKRYESARNMVAEKGTSRLSPHHKFGTVSIRETYHAIKKQKFDTKQFLAELYWRDFYLHIAYHFPKVFKESFLPWANNIRWLNDKKQFKAWTEGRTGVPIVDAGMRQLNEMGWMHNRARMIVASYLTKNLLIDWRWGERYFASKLLDYDPASNNGGWQWSASVGADPRPLRIFNPYTQAEKYDPEATYIKEWVSELKSVNPTLLTDGKEHDLSLIAPGYPSPLVNQKESFHRAREAYAKAKRG
jgi:deoxyribodipyrimidine photo-lyase